jgi:hypothetical protein
MGHVTYRVIHCYGVAQDGNFNFNRFILFETLPLKEKSIKVLGWTSPLSDFICTSARALQTCVSPIIGLNICIIYVFFCMKFRKVV